MNYLKQTFLGSIILGMAAFGAGTVNAATLTISCGTGPQLQLCKESAARWTEKTGNQVNTISTPNSSTEILALYQQMLAGGSSDVDVFMIDVIWPGILGNYFIDLKEHVKNIDEAVEKNFAPIIANNTVDGHLVAMPWYTDAGLLYYRSDLLEKYGEQVPATWAELERIAKKIQDGERKAGNNNMWGFVWQGRAYEGLTCDALEWVVSHNGGTIVNDKGEVTIDNPDAAAAIQQAAGWVGTITPEGVLNYAEEEARGVFQSGNAVFMRNWPYAYSLAQGEGSPVKGKVGVAVLPKGGEDGRHAATLGGWQLAVSRYSKNPDVAADLVMFLTSPEEQKFRAIKGSYLPTIKDLYKDPEILKANPFFGQLYEVFVNAVPRPSSVTGTKYNQVSNEFWNAVHSVLSGQAKAENSLANLQNTLMRLSRGGKAW